MANRQISQLTAGTIGTTDLLVFQDAAGAAEAKKATVQDVLNLAGGSGVQTVKVSLTSADILALNSTPYTLVAAQGAGTMINVLKVWYLYRFVTTAYTGGGLLTVTMGPINIAPALANLLSSSTDLIGRPGTGVTTTTSSFGYDNTPVLLNCSLAQTLGDSTLDVYVTYDVITL